MVSFPQRSYPMGGESGSSAFNKEKTIIGTIFEHCESPVDSSIPRSSPSPCNLPLKEEPQREAITVTERFLDDGFKCFTEFSFSADTGLLVNIKTSLYTSIPNIRPVTTSSSFLHRLNLQHQQQH